MKIIKLFGFTLFITLASCATYDERKEVPDHFETKTYSLLKESHDPLLLELIFFFFDFTNTYIEKIDGKPANLFEKYSAVMPGKHEVTVKCQSTVDGKRFTYRQKIEVDAKAGVVHRITGRNNSNQTCYLNVSETDLYADNKIAPEVYNNTIYGINP
jgi:hypothetical protein